LKGVTLGLLTGIVGLVISFSSFGLDIEENVGLEILFHLRGVRKAPSDVVVVGLDKLSADSLGLPIDPRKWPRSFHARLIENLIEKGAAAIAFDMFFEDPGPPQGDTLFSEALEKAHNVILTERLRVERLSLTDKEKAQAGDLTITRLVPPIPLLERYAFALAPFPLPKVPVKVSQYWTFKTGAGDTPTLPVVAFQLFAMQAHDEFILLLEKTSPYPIEESFRDRSALIAARSVKRFMSGVREIFGRDPQIARKMLQELRDPKSLSVELKKHQMVRALIKMYESPNSRYLNFYGPPRTIPTVPYYQALTGGKELDVKGKVVFVGLSELVQPEQKDGFNTVFSRSDGLDISGVEIAATAFSNLLEDMPLRPVSLPFHVAVLLLWGTVIGISCRFSSSIIAVLSIAGLSVLYLAASTYLFRTYGIWYPVVIPLFFQTFLAFNSSLLWKYIDSNRERQNIRKAFEYYLPNEVVDRLSKDIVNLAASDQLVYGVCLSTDAEHYTSLSETMDPDKLGCFMNKYYEAVFRPIKKHGGIVSNVVGDSALAIWVATEPGITPKGEACLAALDIAGALREFNRSSGSLQLPTRIGLHSGNILLGNIGAFDHYEYRPVGDIVNTATRIEGLNKYVGTRILASDDVLDQVKGLLTRQIGKFLMVGKTQPMIVHELICRMEESDEQQRDACAIFSGALDAFWRRSWDEAIRGFHEAIKVLGKDGPSTFYLDLCEHHKEDPPGESWEGAVHMDKK